MKIVFSRKGFDSSSGGCPSPIVDGRPISLPIPSSKDVSTTYADLGFAGLVHKVTKGRLQAGATCHHDPMFVEGECLLGQQGAAQTHLARNGVGVGDTFLFFGLFADELSGERHHRIFGFMTVASCTAVSDLSPSSRAELAALKHPHVLRSSVDKDMIYRGKGRQASRDLPSLRLTRPNGPLSQWLVPDWLRERGLTFHGDEKRWATPGELSVVARGQEFVCDIGELPAAHRWLRSIIGEICA